MLRIIIVGVLCGIGLIILLYRPIFKRVFDILLSGTALILLSPVIATLAILVKKKLGEPIVFKQRRPGRYGKTFFMHKFRTMTDATDENGAPLPDEKRLTKFGNFLRATSLDELLELWDIFRGKMSIVGPRPLRVEYLPLYNDEQARRHKVRPGLTGLAQVNGRNALTWEQKFALDVEYVESYNIFTDIAIIFKTVWQVFKRDGISQEGSATMPFFKGTKDINILITSCGRRVELVKSFIAARDRLEISGKVICADCLETAPALYFGDKHYIIPKISDENFVPELLKIAHEEDIDLIIPTIDTELQILADNKRDFAEIGTKILVAEPEIVRICGDKEKSAEFFAEHGFDAPYTLTDEEVKNYCGEYPLFIKPRDGSSSKNAFLINNEKELAFFREYVENPIVQQCVRGKEYTIDCLTDFDGNPLLIVPRQRLAIRSGEILKGKIDKNEEIISVVRRLLSELHYVGYLTVQGFLTDEGKLLLIEMNARFGGGAPMSIKAGADFCEKLYRLLREEQLAYDDSYIDGRRIVRFDDSVVLE